MIPSADLGEESCLADIHVNSYIRAEVNVSDKIDGEDRRYIGKGMISTLLPYRIQDGYTRVRSPRTFRAACLENEYMRAVFLPELGGRLWSLYDKRERRELLYRNDVFQPANLALRNAWFSGGVEWNVGIKGHNPLTASPLFAQRAYTDEGSQALRMYEYERIRGVVYIIDATLSEASLVVSITVENTAEEDTPMYWWSNIAVPETERTRVIAPADEAFFCAYTDGAYFLDKATMPKIDGRDITYAEASSRSRDFFFNIPDASDKWIATADEGGRGLLHVSDPILKGRKLFVWGNHRGGRHWNEWLTDQAGPYVEIQAGLLKTQLEHFIMPGKSCLTWRESYSALSLSPTVAHGEFHDAVSAASSLASQQYQRLSSVNCRIVKTDPLAVYGSGFGALESLRRGKSVSELCVFPEDSLGQEQEDWLMLLSGSFPQRDAAKPIRSYAVGEGWLRLMEAASGSGWYYHCQLGVMRYAAGDMDGAYAAFLTSVACEKNAWAYRNLAMLEKNIKGNPEKAAEYILLAFRERPDYRPLVTECAETLLHAGKGRLWIELFGELSAELRAHGRLRMLLGAAYTRCGELSLARTVITADLTVDDIKEGEYSLSAIWTELYTRILAEERGVAPSSLTPEEVLSVYPLPRALDFRMH